jgi:RecJ-like exonuclease
MRTQVKEIANIIKEVEKISKESKIKCDKCNGEGEIYNRMYYNVNGTIQETLREEACDKRKGKGYLYLSNTLASHLKIIEVLKLLLIKVPTEKE